MTPQKSKAQILKESLQAYWEDIGESIAIKRAVYRSVYGGSCEYLTEDGRMCAFGRCMINPQTDVRGNVSNFDDHNARLKPEYRGHDLYFWRSIQKLHDQGSNWESKSSLKDATALIMRLFHIPDEDILSMFD